MTIDRLQVEGSQEQGSMAWKIARLGKFTASRIADIMKKGRGKDETFGATAITAIAEVAAERELASDLLQDDEKFGEFCQLQCAENRAMRHGHEWEDIARRYYELNNDAYVEQCGLLLSNDVDNLAASPDGVIVDNRKTIKGCIEIKCPATIKTFKRYQWFINDGESLKAENEKYYWQVQTVMAVTGAKWCDFIAYNPWNKAGRELHIVRIARNQADIDSMEERVRLANAYIDEHNGVKNQSTFAFPEDGNKRTEVGVESKL